MRLHMEISGSMSSPLVNSTRSTRTQHLYPSFALPLWQHPHTQGDTTYGSFRPGDCTDRLMCERLKATHGQDDHQEHSAGLRPEVPAADGLPEEGKLSTERRRWCRRTCGRTYGGGSVHVSPTQRHAASKACWYLLSDRIMLIFSTGPSYSNDGFCYFGFRPGMLL